MDVIPKLPAAVRRRLFGVRNATPSSDLLQILGICNTTIPDVNNVHLEDGWRALPPPTDPKNAF